LWVAGGVLMFCPVCESEYEPHIRQCPDDGAQLVDQLNPETSHDDSEASFVLLHNFGLATEAEMVNELLMKNGIRSVIQSGSADALSPLLSATSVGAAVLVDERDYDRAQELYASIFGDDTTPLVGGGDDEENDDDED
jgi:Putative prokaryotic signal transducing protein